jgi:hypothetical protein
MAMMMTAGLVRRLPVPQRGSPGRNQIVNNGDQDMGVAPTAPLSVYVRRLIGKTYWINQNSGMEFAFSPLERSMPSRGV